MVRFELGQACNGKFMNQDKHVMYVYKPEQTCNGKFMNQDKHVIVSL